MNFLSLPFVLFYFRPPYIFNFVVCFVSFFLSPFHSLPQDGSKQQHVESLSGAASHSTPSMELGVRSLDRGVGSAGGYNQQHTPNRGMGHWVN